MERLVFTYGRRRVVRESDGLIVIEGEHGGEGLSVSREEALWLQQVALPAILSDRSGESVA